MQKKVPIRHCVGCGEGSPKKELLRVLRSPSGSISLDATCRQAGRGAYLCKNPACLQKAQKRRALERAFASQIPPEVYAALQDAICAAQPVQ